MYVTVSVPLFSWNKTKRTLAFGGCDAEFSANSDGAVITQVIAFADVTGLDGQVCVFPRNQRPYLEARTILNLILVHLLHGYRSLTQILPVTSPS